MQLGLSALYAFLDNCRTPTLVLATVIRTQGASYRKAGAMMLIDANMNTSGLVSGGCLEDDLKAHAEGVFTSSKPVIVVYDLSQEEAASMWGLGLGCGGRIEVLLEQINKDNQFGGLTALRESFFSGLPCLLHKVVRSSSDEQVGSYTIESIEQSARETQHAHGATSLPDNAVENCDRTQTTLSIPISPVKRLLVCGAGPDAIPLVKLATTLGWQVVLSDVRPAYLKPEFFPEAIQLICDNPGNIGVAQVGPIQAAVVMTHNVEHDCTWLQKLYALPIAYIGLLGPAARRDLLLDRAGLAMEPRLHGPAGLDIGATLPDEIALSILAQIHAALRQRSGEYLSACRSETGL